VKSATTDDGKAWASSLLHLGDHPKSGRFLAAKVACFYFATDSRLGLHTSAAGSGQIEIERSAIWNPGVGAMPAISLPTCAFCGHFNSRLKVSLDHVLVETDGGLLPTAELDPFEWKNGHNLYRTSAANIVERLRSEVKSGIRAP
jgi:hypothetical protein